MFKKKIAVFVEKVRKLNGEPHYVALGMAIGVFVAITPTIPFHTVLAIGFAILFKASKPAAILGVWVSNPFTVVFLYLACYKTGHLFFEDSPRVLEIIQSLAANLEGDAQFSQKITLLSDFIKTQIRPFLIMNLGGVILGIPAAVITYGLVKNTITRFRERKDRKAENREEQDSEGRAPERQNRDRKNGLDKEVKP